MCAWANENLVEPQFLELQELGAWPAQTFVCLGTTQINMPLALLQDRHAGEGKAKSQLLQDSHAGEGKARSPPWLISTCVWPVPLPLQREGKEKKQADIPEKESDL